MDTVKYCLCIVVVLLCGRILILLFLQQFCSGLSFNPYFRVEGALEWNSM